MPWKGVTVSEQRQRFLEAYLLNYYSITELAERFGISSRTAHTHPHPSGTSGHQGKWINRYKQHGQAGFHELSRRPPYLPLANRSGDRRSTIDYSMLAEEDDRLAVVM